MPRTPHQKRFSNRLLYNYRISPYGYVKIDIFIFENSCFMEVPCIKVGMPAEPASSTEVEIPSMNAGDGKAKKTKGQFLFRHISCHACQP